MDGRNMKMSECRVVVWKGEKLRSVRHGCRGASSETINTNAVTRRTQHPRGREMFSRVLPTLLSLLLFRFRRWACVMGSVACCLATSCGVSEAIIDFTIWEEWEWNTTPFFFCGWQGQLRRFEWKNVVVRCNEAGATLVRTSSVASGDWLFVLRAGMSFNR